MANNLFFSDIGEDTYRALYRRVINLDRTITSYQDRSTIVNDIIEDNQYLVNYFSDYYSPVLDSTSALSAENNICQLVEILTNYLLTSTESSELDDKQQTIYINTNSFNKSEEFPLGETTELLNNTQTAFIAFNTNNYKRDKTQTIKPSDLKRTDYLGSVLRDYQALLDTINVKLHSPADGRRMLYTRAKHSLKDDQIIAKDSLLGVWGYTTHPTESTGRVGYITLDETTVSSLLRNPPTIDNEDLWLLNLDLNAIITQCNFSDYKLALIAGYRSGMTFQELSTALGKTVKNTWLNLRKIVNTIVNVHNQQVTSFIKKHNHI